MENNYIHEIICKILMLQHQDFDSDLSSCDKPFLGPSIPNSVYNTRPIQLYNSYTATPWSFSYTSDGTTSTSDIFRIESCDTGTVTVRLLSYDVASNTYTNLNQFVTIRFDTIGAIRCLPDTFITL